MSRSYCLSARPERSPAITSCLGSGLGLGLGYHLLRRTSRAAAQWWHSPGTIPAPGSDPVPTRLPGSPTRRHPATRQPGLNYSGGANAGPAHRWELHRRIRRDAPGVLAVDSAHVSDLVERRPLGLGAADAGS